MRVLIASRKIVSHCNNSNVYANEMDIVSIIAINGDIGLYKNMETGKTFVCNKSNIREIDDSMIVKPDVVDGKKKLSGKSKSVNDNQISMF